MSLANASTSPTRSAAFIRSIVAFTRAVTADNGPLASSGAPVSRRALGRHVEGTSDTRCVARLTSASVQYEGVSVGAAPVGENHSVTIPKLALLVGDGNVLNVASPSCVATCRTNA